LAFLSRYIRDWARAAADGWNQFWFTPADPATLGLIRILAGAMLFYTHLAWGLQLADFFGADGWLSSEYARQFHGTPYAWSYLYGIESMPLLWALHGVALIVFAMLTLGLFTRITSALGFLITVAYAHRVPGALFGLDQINALLAMYVMLGPAGDAFSLDRWLSSRRLPTAAPAAIPSVTANIAIRLIQVHMCIVYLFAGCGKLFGETWWDGTALWGALANYEYQSVDMTWLAGWPLLINLMSHVTLAWEISYAALVWPRLTRPVVLALAVPLHLGIAVAMGMITFGLIMLVANLAFVSPQLVRSCLRAGDRTTAGQGSVGQLAGGSPGGRAARRRRR
jgi:hypothetical protein